VQALQLQAKFESISAIYRQDYIENPDETERLVRYREHLARFSQVINNLSGFLEKTENLKLNHTREGDKWLRLMVNVMNNVMTRYERMKVEFADSDL
jgi:hypothetical protein